ncbi:MAG: UbiH/UbiF/VisC/COQ6 family ubiquinone biosynthesis hydroxylase [Chakrabartia sp.]
MDSHDVLILGGGLIGQTMALALDRHGLRSAVIDPVDPTTTLTTEFDGRVTAISSSSWKLFDALGLGPRMRAEACPIARIEVRDGADGAPLDFQSDAEDDALGLMLENRVLRRSLWDLVQGASHITRRFGHRAQSVERTEAGVTARLESGEVLAAPLLLVCEGRHSSTRAEAGIPVAAWDYASMSIVTAMDHDRPHGGTAHQIFYPGGPVALLPMNPGTRSALVWSLPEAEAKGMINLGERAFLGEVDRATGGLLGSMQLVAPRALYPLQFRHSAKMVDQRLALVGDAGHGIHPIAGQGFNLGLRDVAALTEVLVDGARLGLDLGDAQLLARYQRWRSADVMAVTLACDSLVRLFGIKGRMARAVRRAGLGMVQRAKPLKDLFMSEARGESGALPVMLTGHIV